MATWQPQRRYTPPPISPVPAAVQAQALGRAPGQVNTAGIDAGTPPAPSGVRFDPPPPGVDPTTWDAYAAGTAPPSAGQRSVEAGQSHWTPQYQRYYQGHGGYQGYVDRQAHRFGEPGGLHLAGPQRGGTAGVGDDVLMDILARKEILQKALAGRGRRRMTGRY